MNEPTATARLVLAFAVLAGTAVVLGKVSERIRVPVMLVFLAVGMLAGSEGIGHLAWSRLAVSVSPAGSPSLHGNATTSFSSGIARRRGIVGCWLSSKAWPEPRSVYDVRRYGIPSEASTAGPSVIWK
jgi:hypothetical protein